jgi:hypothetical protein
VGGLFSLAACKGKKPDATKTFESTSTLVPAIVSIPSSTVQLPTQTPGITATRTRRPSRTPTITRTRGPTKTPTQTWTRRPTNTPTQTWTRGPTNTPTSTTLADILLPTPPARGISAYRLRPWTESDSAALVDRVAGRKYVASPEPEYNAIPNQIPGYILAFQAESLLRFPQSPNWLSTAWETIRYSPPGTRVAGMREGQDLFSFLVENLLNQQAVQVEELSNYLITFYFRIDDSLRINNLFGDAQDAWVIHVHTSYFLDYDSVYAIHQVNNLYQVKSVMDWEISALPGAGMYYSLHNLGDTNGNHIQELGIVSESGMSGIPQTWAQSLIWYEWDPSIGKFTTDRYRIFYQTCEEMGQGPCRGEWKFSNQQLTTSEYWYTQAGCPDLQVQSIYGWNGKKYSLESEQYILPDINQPECRIAWADGVINHWERGWQDDRAIDIISSALDSWPAAMDSQWGPASKDYFRLRLGIWTDLRGEDEKAVNLLQGLVEEATDPKYDLPSRLAQTYLQARQQNGLVGACTQVEQAWQDEKTAFYSQHQLSDNIPTLRETWGFASDRWIGPGIFSKLSLCVREDAIISSAGKFENSSTNALKKWLDQAGFHWFDVQPTDLDGDGINDWLALIEFHDSRTDEVEVWTFLHRPKGLVAKRVDSFISKLPTLILDIHSFQPDDFSNLVNIVHVNDSLYAFYITLDNEVTSLLNLSSVTYFRIDHTSHGSSIIVSTSSKYDGDKKTEYLWDPSLMGFIDQDEFLTHEDEAGRLLFQESNFPAAINYIEKFLTEAPPEPRIITFCTDGGCEYRPDWFRPHLRYMLGIAYEMNNQAEQAVKVYYDLWKDYPANIFGLAAAAKLEPTAP